MNSMGLKTLGLIGGMSWESTVPYYREINETVKARLGRLHSAQVLITTGSQQGLDLVGMFLWARLPKNMSAVDLLPFAVDKGVAFVPSVQEIHQGVAALALALQTYAATP